MNATVRARRGALRRRRDGRPGPGGGGGRPRPPRRRGRDGAAGVAARQRSASPAASEHAAPTARAPVSPSSSIRTNPASVVPMIAPIVFAAYSRPNASAQGRAAGEVARQGRQRGAHQDRRRRQREDRQRDRRSASAPRRPFEGRIDAAIQLVDEPERERRHETTTTQHELEEAVHPQRDADPVGDPAADEAADRHAAEEAGQDRRHRLGRVPEHEHELARPDDLVDEAGRAGQDEDGEDGDRAGHGRSRDSVDGGHRW